LLAATQINAVARRAGALLQPFAARDHGRVCERALLLRKVGASAAATLTTAALLPSPTCGRWVLSRRCRNGKRDAHRDGTDE
jgi:hypothetical protein